MIEKLKNKVLPQLIIIYTRYLLGGAFVFASVIKIKGKRFITGSGAEQPIDTAWHFFETMYQSGLYWQFIGMGQLVAGFLLMTQKYSKLGAIVNFSIILNVFIITISYDFASTPQVTGMMLLANLVLLLWDWDSLKVLFNLPPSKSPGLRLENDLTWQITGLVIFSFTFVYRIMVDTYDGFFWFSTCALMGILGLIVGWRRRKVYSIKFNS